MQAVGEGRGVEPQVGRCDTLWDRFLRAYCIVLAVLAVACFFLAITVPVPWAGSTLGNIVWAFILGMIGGRAVASMMVRLGGTVVFEGLVKPELGGPVGQNDVAGAEHTAGTVRMPITLAERLGGAIGGASRIVRPKAANAVCGLVLGVFGVILIAIAAAGFIRSLYFLVCAR